MTERVADKLTKFLRYCFFVLLSNLKIYRFKKKAANFCENLFEKLNFCSDKSDKDLTDWLTDCLPGWALEQMTHLKNEELFIWLADERMDTIKNWQIKF